MSTTYFHEWSLQNRALNATISKQELTNPFQKVALIQPETHNQYF